MPPSLAEQQLAAIVESSDDAIVGKDLEEMITSWNRGAERLYGYSAAEAVGQSIAMLIPPDRVEEDARVMARVRAGQRVESYETVRIRKDGTPVDVSMTVSPIRDASGAIVGVSKIARPITEQTRARREAAEARDRLAFLAEVGALLSSSLDYNRTLDRAVHLALPRLGDYCHVVLQDDRGALRHVAAGHVASDKEPIVRELAMKAIEQRKLEPVPTFADQIVATGRTMVVTHDQLLAAAAGLDLTQLDPDIVRLAAQLAPWAYMGAPLFVLRRVVGAITFATTEESRREYTPSDVALLEEFARRVSVAIENARLFRQSEDFGRLKDEFLATLSHELRTPLSAILGWARMLASGQLDEERRRQAIDAILRNAHAQAQLVEDVLDVARGMAGNLRLEMGPVDLVTIAQRGVEAITPAAAAKRVAVELNAPAPVPVTGDAGRLQQIVWNLMSNAVKFTPSNGVVRVEVVADGDAQLSVSDTGAGIAPAFLPYVFDKFRQGDASPTRQHGGLGLGLAIARHLAEMHGGTIEAASEGEGRGATFRVRLPLRVVDS